MAGKTEKWPVITGHRPLFAGRGRRDPPLLEKSYFTNTSLYMGKIRTPSFGKISKTRTPNLVSTMKGNINSTNRSFKTLILRIHYVKSVLILSYSGPYFPAFGLNTDQNTGTFYPVIASSVNSQLLQRQSALTCELTWAHTLPKKDPKIYESRDTHPWLLLISAFFLPEISKFCYIKKYRCRLHFST